MATPAIKNYPSISTAIEPELSTLEKRLLNEYQKGFPLTATPYADIAEELGTSEALVLTILQKLKDQGFITRVGPVFKPKRVGTSTLAAMSIPVEKLQQVANIVSSFDEVNHNYEREHVFNLWFVITTRDQTQLQEVLNQIQAHTGYPVMDLPLERQYHIDLGFPLWC
ncbi:MAG TPA: Lrp/AsnC family transcriptional regulator [Thiolapillus brandeum]|uniref:siroheme decarboxylase n=1 Tax=Thiolapillus brandeum TaxID=1076588 RepID=A0A831K2J6_9GAMM|nr:Lrp/AsnC family transcriptional regulator [Thiolapillus brandeum]